MYPWISRTLDFWLEFCEQKCGLYMDVYGKFKGAKIWNSVSDQEIIRSGLEIPPQLSSQENLKKGNHTVVLTYHVSLVSFSSH